MINTTPDIFSTHQTSALTNIPNSPICINFCSDINISPTCSLIPTDFVKNDNTFLDITVSPIPSKGMITIDMNEQWKKTLTTISLIDIYGNQLWSTTLMPTANIPINLKHLTPDVYFLRLNNGTQIITKKIILN